MPPETSVADPFTDQTTCDIYASLLRQGLNTQRRFMHANGGDESDLPWEHVSGPFCYFLQAQKQRLSLRRRPAIPANICEGRTPRLGSRPHGGSYIIQTRKLYGCRGNDQGAIA